LDGLRIKRTQDQLAYERSLNRYNQLLEPPDPIEIAVAEAQLATAKAELDAAQREWERIKDGASPAEIAVLQATLDDAIREWERVKDGPAQEDVQILETQISAAQAMLQQTELTAPFDGIITTVDAQPGDQVNFGSLAFQLDDTSHLFVDLYISEIDINQVKVGQNVMLTFDSVFAKEYQGKVVDVAQIGTALLGAVSFKVSVEILDADEAVKPGMSSKAEIITNHVENVLMVPNRAVRVEDGEWFVYVLRDDLFSDGLQLKGDRQPFRRQPALNSRIQAVSIEVGERSNYFTEIISDEIQPGDQIILQLPDEFTNEVGESSIVVEINP
jgi:HlyD family secretion protein